MSDEQIKERINDAIELAKDIKYRLSLDDGGLYEPLGDALIFKPVG